MVSSESFCCAKAGAPTPSKMQVITIRDITFFITHSPFKIYRTYAHQLRLLTKKLYNKNMNLQLLTIFHNGQFNVCMDA